MQSTVQLVGSACPAVDVFGCFLAVFCVFLTGSHRSSSGGVLLLATLPFQESPDADGSECYYCDNTNGDAGDGALFEAVAGSADGSV